MAGRPKQGIDYSGWSVDIFDSDPKIDKLLDAKGWRGFGIYFFLCQRAYKTNGYFYKWSYDDCATTARKMGGGINSGTVEETVRFCFQVDLFDQRLFDRWGILTSRGIQRRFWAVLSERRIKTAYEEYWLLGPEECNGLVKVSLKTDLQPTNEYLQPTNSETLSRKKSKVKKSKVKESKEERESGVAAKAATMFLPDSFEMLCVNTLIHSCLEGFPGAKVPVTDEEKSQWCDHIEKMKRIDHRTEAQIEIALKYAVTNQFWKANIRSTKKFREKFETLYMQSQAGKTAVRMEDDKAERLRRWAENE